MKYPKQHNIDGVYFRIERNGEWKNICFSDLTKDEMYNIMEGRSEAWLKSLCEILGNTIHNIGEQFDIYSSRGDNDEY